MGIPKNRFSITGKLWANPKEVGNKGNIKLPLVVDNDGHEDSVLWVNALCCSENTRTVVNELKLKKWDMIDVDGILLPPEAYKVKKDGKETDELRAGLTMFVNTISLFEEKLTESQEEASKQEENTNDEDIPF